MNTELDKFVEGEHIKLIIIREFLVWAEKRGIGLYNWDVPAREIQVHRL